MPTSSLGRRDLLKTAIKGTTVAGFLSSASHAAGSAKSPIRIGLIGVGNRAQAHISYLKALPKRYRVTAMCDLVKEKAESSAALLGTSDIKIFTDYKNLIRAQLCDAVLIATPNYTHKQIAIDALRGGLHVMCEKPMATTLADAQAMVETVDKSDRIFMIAQQMRYAAVYRKARELLNSGAIGELKYVWAEEFRGDWARLYDDPEENVRKNWRYRKKLSGGSLVEKCCHDFDILGWLIDKKPLRVTATGGLSVYTGRDTLDHATVAVEYPDGVKFSLGLCMFASKHQANTTLIGSRGMINFPRKGNKLTLRRRGKRDEHFDIQENELDKLENYRHRGTGALHLAFLDAIDKGQQPFADVRVGYNALRIPIAAQEAISSRKIIDMDQLESEYA